MYKTTVLDNGLKIVTADMPNMQSLSIGFWVKTGGRYEDKKISGISHFLEHLLFEETANRSSKQIKEAIEGLGGSLNGFTSEEATCYLVKILSKHLDTATDVLSDMILNAALLDKAIEKERSVIIEEIKMYMDLPSHFVADLLNEIMWPEHPLGMFLTGTAESVKSITRQDLLTYKNRFYAPNNIIISAASSLSHDKIVKSSRKYFEKIPAQPAEAFKPVTETQKNSRSLLRYKDTEQMHLSMGVPCVSAIDPDRFAMSLLHIILGANMSSRLFQEIREKRGLAYEISTGVKKYKDTGAFVVSAGIKNEKLAEAIEVIVNEMKKIKKEPASELELRRAKEFYTGQMLMALEDTADHMLWMGEQIILLDKIIPSEEVLGEIEKVTPDDISRAANKFFRSEKLNLAVIGPVKDSQKKQIDKISETLG
jgi:predicted Zn-dependent peptidase